MFDIPYNHAQNLGITVIFIVLSITCGYIVRRFLNKGLHRTAHHMAKRFAR